ncbi:HNH endonuclease [Altericroceibacterium endophyticum]|nr:HNH endonuclease [Altericroceibacterium endophyticum]
MGQRIHWHHTVPESKGGRQIVPLHPICHRTIHANFTNAQLARIGTNRELIAQNEIVANFLIWIADKPADFYAPTYGKRG